MVGLVLELLAAETLRFLKFQALVGWCSKGEMEVTRSMSYEHVNADGAPRS